MKERAEDFGIGKQKHHAQNLDRITDNWEVTTMNAVMIQM